MFASIIVQFSRQIHFFCGVMLFSVLLVIHSLYSTCFFLPVFDVDPNASKVLLNFSVLAQKCIWESKWSWFRWMYVCMPIRCLYTKSLIRITVIESERDKRRITAKIIMSQNKMRKEKRLKQQQQQPVKTDEHKKNPKEHANTEHTANLRESIRQEWSTNDHHQQQHYHGCCCCRRSRVVVG